MRRAIKVLTVLAAVCAMVWAASPVWGACGFSIPMLQGGLGANPAGALLTSATHVNGFWFEVGNADTNVGSGDGLGNDCIVGDGSAGSAFCGYPAFTRPLVAGDPGEQWVKGASAGTPLVNYDWGSSGTDGCVGAANITTVVYGHYVIDSNDGYAIAVVKSENIGQDVVDLDSLNTGIGPNGNDVPFASLNSIPQLSNIVTASDDCLSADIGPMVNMFSDDQGPYAGVVDVSGVQLTNDGVAEPCDPLTGCSVACITRPTGTNLDASLCWAGNAQVIGTQSGGGAGACGITGGACASDADCGAPPGSGSLVCTLAPTFSCVVDTDCFGGGAGPCVADPCVVPPIVTDPVGPPIVGGCQEIGGDNVNDRAIARATKNRGFTVFRWEATQFAVLGWNLFDVTRLERKINGSFIPRDGDNDGDVTRYEFVATGKMIKGGRRFELEMVRTDGQKIRFDVE